MFLPIALASTHATIINKTIVYSDTVLSLKDMGENIKVTSISKVGEYSLENCLKTIFDSNPDVIFNTIQYSKENKTVYFYTNKEISKKEYEESKYNNYNNYKPLRNSSEIVEEINSVLSCEKSDRSDSVSLFDVTNVIKKNSDSFDNMQKKIAGKFNSALYSKFNNDYHRVFVSRYNYDNNTLIIGYYYNFGEIKHIEISKTGDDYYLKRSEENFYIDEIFSALSPLLPLAFEECLKYAEYDDTSNTALRINSINSNFKVNIGKQSVSVVAFQPYQIFSYDFELRVYDNKYSVKCNSSLVNETVKNNEQNIFKNIYVKIDDCPVWCQEELYEIRQKELEKRIKLLELKKEKKYLERLKDKKKKREELKKKLFPFIKSKDKDMFADNFTENAPVKTLGTKQ